MTSPALSSRAWSPFSRYRRSLWLLTTRDLRVRYSTSFLGYFWSILDPLVMAAIYWFVFTQVFHRGVGHEPYIVFLLSGLLPWMWFTGSVSDATVAFTREAKLVRSTTIPRTKQIDLLKSHLDSSSPCGLCSHRAENPAPPRPKQTSRPLAPPRVSSAP